MRKYQIESSNIESVGYDVKEQKLVVTFKGGNSYQYDNTSPAAVCNLIFADSVGRVFHNTIKKQDFLRLGPDE